MQDTFKVIDKNYNGDYTYDETYSLTKNINSGNEESKYRGRNDVYNNGETINTTKATGNVGLVKNNKKENITGEQSNIKINRNQKQELENSSFNFKEEIAPVRQDIQKTSDLNAYIEDVASRETNYIII